MEPGRKFSASASFDLCPQMKKMVTQGLNSLHEADHAPSLPGVLENAHAHASSAVDKTRRLEQ